MIIFAIIHIMNASRVLTVMDISILPRGVRSVISYSSVGQEATPDESLVHE
jgi:hypothetical protein